MALATSQLKNCFAVLSALVPIPAFPDLSSCDPTLLLDLLPSRAGQEGESRPKQPSLAPVSEQPVPYKLSHGGHEETSVY